MGSKQTRYHPRLADDVGEVISKWAAKNGRTLPQELDFILRPMFMEPRHLICGIGPNGQGEEYSMSASIADELSGIELKWDKKKREFVKRKAKR